jgi:hypothetical protein
MSTGQTVFPQETIPLESEIRQRNQDNARAIGRPVCNIIETPLEEGPRDTSSVDITLCRTTPFLELVPEASTNETLGGLLTSVTSASSWPRTLLCSSSHTSRSPSSEHRPLLRRRCLIGAVFVQFSRLKYFLVDCLGPTLRRYFVSIFAVPFGSGFVSAITQHFVQVYRTRTPAAPSYD